MKTVVYVDGVNLYYRALEGTPFKWIDLPVLCDRVLGGRVELVRYFTARITPQPHDPQAPQRQQALLRAMAADARISLHYGTFRTRQKTGPLLRPASARPTIATIATFEEKGSDVNLVAHALVDAYEGRADTVFLLTNDSDLAEPARLLRARGTKLVTAQTASARRSGGRCTQQPKPLGEY